MFPSRLNHILRVEQMAVELANITLDVEKKRSCWG